MREVTTQNFGYLISYVLPGFIVLWGLGDLSPTVEGWLGVSSADGPTVGGFLYVTIGSVGAGLLCSTIRWMVIDTIHHHTGLKKPAWDFALLADRVEAFSRLVADHYVYYKFYGNSLIAVILAGSFVWLSPESSTSTKLGMSFVGVMLVGILFLGSRDALKRYYERMTALLVAIDPSLKSPATQVAHIPPDSRHEIGH